MAEPRLLQVFLGKWGAYEVSVTPVKHELVCTCPGFSRKSTCKHLDYVRERLDEEGGYAVNLPDEAAQAMVEAVADPSRWRMFVLENAPVVVL